jgi:hypothetical protein
MEEEAWAEEKPRMSGQDRVQTLKLDDIKIQSVSVGTLHTHDSLTCPVRNESHLSLEWAVWRKATKCF